MGLLLEHLHFLDAAQDLNRAIIGSYNLLLVFCSVLVACMAAYSALRIVERINAAPTYATKGFWLLTGAFTMGIGVWAMHFVGMLALILPVLVTYDPTITLLSMLPSILASGIMLQIISRSHVGAGRLWLGGTLMGVGIGLMHYTGMAAMRTTATMRYDLELFIASNGVAIVLATVALYTKFFISRALRWGERWTQLAASVIMGLAVAGMHYTGMDGVYFFPGDNTHSHLQHLAGTAVNPIWLGAWVTLISVIIIGITVFVTMLDRRLEVARKHTELLESLIAGRTQELQITNRKLQIELAQRRQTQEALRLAKEAAEAATQAKAEFLANMSHEIRTPLNAIVGMTELLMDTPLVAEQRDFTDTIRTSSDSLLSVINDILDFSKIEAHKMELENQPFDLCQCVEEALDMMMLKAAEKKLELAYWADASAPTTIVGDITRLRQILVNLLNNAIKFTDAGEVVISVESKPLPISMVNTVSEDEPGGESGRELCELHFYVRDTGIGLPPDRLDRLFQPFSQIDASTSRKYGGTGLGLLISKRLSELMGGRMWVESAGVGQGATFHFTIQTPVVTVPAPLYVDATEPLPSGKRGLIVDDNAISCQIVTRQLEAWGIQSRAAASGEEALRWVQSGEHFDFAILDLYMPGMDGFTLAKHLHQHPGSAQMPLIMLTSHGDKSVHAEAERLHFAAVLAKPVKQAQLNRVLRHILGQHAPVPQPTAQLSSFDHLMAERMPLRILLAEDNVVNQKVAQYTLARLGYQVQVANNGLEVLHELGRQRYDVVLMDVQMPEMDGIETTRRIIAQWPPEQRPFIIAMTAHALTGDEAKCMDAGMNGYVSKPIQIEKLVAALKQSRQAPLMVEMA